MPASNMPRGGRCDGPERALEVDAGEVAGHLTVAAKRYSAVR